MKAPKRAGLYEIHNTVSGGFYVGSSTWLAQRLAVHRSHLRHRRHANSHLQAAWNKYGAEAFTFRVLCILERDEVEPSETRLLARCVGQPACYNIGTQARAAMRGRKLSPAHSAALHVRGRRLSPETRERMRQAALNRSAEHRANLQRALRGRKLPPVTEAARRHLSEANRGRPWSPARRAAFERLGR